jgi:hypothetical protein
VGYSLGPPAPAGSLPWLNTVGTTAGCDSDASVPPAGGESSSARRDDVQAEDARGRAGAGESEHGGWRCPCAIALEQHTALPPLLVSCLPRMGGTIANVVLTGDARVTEDSRLGSAGYEEG